MRRLLNFLIPLSSGLLFGVGLIVSGMTQPAKVQGFLDIGGLWDPSLGLVMGGAIAVTLPVFQWGLRRRKAPPMHGSIEKRLVVGSFLFGIGWGISGFCPGPALVSASAGSGDALAYVLTMGIGMLVGNRFEASHKPHLRHS